MQLVDAVAETQCERICTLGRMMLCDLLIAHVLNVGVEAIVKIFCCIILSVYYMYVSTRVSL